jgi:plastocyanin domain-containing protein
MLPHQRLVKFVSGAKYILTPSVLKKDVPVRMEADLNTLKGCSRDVVISAFGVRKYVNEGDNIITFTPTKTGTINIACSMNMYRGTFTVE